MAKSTWRFEFVDINKSITITESESKWIGFAVIRAPKGTTEAMFVPANNKARIEAMFGYASADWPDLFEVIDFNNEYGLYISAPTVDVAEYPNYYGGVYLTKDGVMPFYRFTNKKDPNFEIGIVPGRESIYYGSVKNNSSVSLLKLNKADEQAVVKIENIPSAIFKKMTYIDFDFPTYKGTYRYKLDKVNNVILPADSMVKDSEHASLVVGTFVFDSATQTYTIYFGGSEAAAMNPKLASTITANWHNDPSITDVPFFDWTKFSRSYGYDYKDLYEASDYDTWVTTTDALAIKEAIMTGKPTKITAANGNTVTLDYKKSLAERFHFVLNIKDSVYSYHVQTSPTAQYSSILIDQVVYDKWVYDIKAPYFVGAESELPVTDAAIEKIQLYDNLCILKDGNSVTLWKYSDVEETYVNDDGDEDTRTVQKWLNVSEDYQTTRILAFEPLLSGKTDADIHHSIYFCEESGLVEMTEDSVEEDYKLRENILYNSYHSKTTEEDNGGELHVSGNFVGSLDEFGVDENNGDNYWEELIPPGESVVYAEAYVVRTFDDDLDDKGIYTGTRIDSVEKKVNGQRFVDYVVDMNIKNGNTGGNCTDATEQVKKKFYQIMKEGMIEAAKPKYADVSLFFECTGLDDLKTYWTGIRTTHYCSTNISPININQQLFENVKKIRVKNAQRGSAQYCQEIQYKDKILRKKYYACPIGAMAAMLMRIMEDYLGGIAPAWLNDKGVGGQLEGMMLRTPVKARWDFEDLDTKVMDEKGINPILMDVDDGVMAVSQRTTEQNAGDWSYLGHSMAFDLCKREIRDNVMKPQLMKKISPYWMEKRQEALDKILKKRTTGSDPIWSQADGDIAGVNDEYTKAQKIFNIAVDVTVYPFSEKVRLTFTNNSQITTVSD